MKIFVTAALSLALSSHLYAQATAVNAGSPVKTSPENSTPTQTVDSPSQSNASSDAPSETTDAPSPVTNEILSLTVDATSKTVFVHLAIKDGKLVEAAEGDDWLFSVRRYIFQTATGVNGTHVGGSYVAEGSGFADFTSCAGLEFSADETITMLGYTIDANRLITSEWYDYDDSGAVAPLDKFFAVKADDQCVKFKIKSYAAGLYEIDYSILDRAQTGS